MDLSIIRTFKNVTQLSMKHILFVIIIVCATSIRAQSLPLSGGYAAVDTAGHIIEQFYYGGRDSVVGAIINKDGNVHALAGLTDVQLYYKSFLTWNDTGWVYSGPNTLPAPPDPTIARRAALRAAGFTVAQTEALIQIFGQ